METPSFNNKITFVLFHCNNPLFYVFASVARWVVLSFPHSIVWLIMMVVSRTSNSERIRWPVMTGGKPSNQSRMDQGRNPASDGDKRTPKSATWPWSDDLLHEQAVTVVTLTADSACLLSVQLTPAEEVITLAL